MTDKRTDDAIGRVKEAAGSLAGDDELKDQGRRDQARSSIKDAADKAADKVKRLVDR